MLTHFCLLMSGGFAGDEENMQEISNIDASIEFLIDSLRMNRLLKTDKYDKRIYKGRQETTA